MKTASMVWHLPPAMAQHARHTISEAGQKLDRQLQASAKAAHHDVVYRFTPQGPHQRPYHADNEACNAWAMTSACVEPLPKSNSALPATHRAPSNPAPYRWAGTAQVTRSGKRGERPVATHEWPHAGAHRPANPAPLEAHLLDEEFLDWVAAMRKSQASDAIGYVWKCMGATSWTRTHGPHACRLPLYLHHGCGPMQSSTLLR